VLATSADGATDGPAFEVVRRGCGFSLAVYDPDSGSNESTMIAGRTHLMVVADYWAGSQSDTPLTESVMTAAGP
jgi:hypothetical protein